MMAAIPIDWSEVIGRILSSGQFKPVSTDHGLEGTECHFWLKNTQALYGVEKSGHSTRIQQG
ncbi:hypothetical protein [Nitrosomonas aestuarii]|uniref:hypothetical protein n=1 Tax=Nitrosomonas aestuarii TaxID=52441 RepID=UPI001113D710|nr:hypothetical protein [Nitrosomonas aestuarii]